MPKEEINEKTAERLLLAARKQGRTATRLTPSIRWELPSWQKAAKSMQDAIWKTYRIRPPSALKEMRSEAQWQQAKGKFLAIAVIGSHDSYTMPCGVCRQVIAEFKIPLIIAGRSEKDYRTFTLVGILPYAFEEDSLKKEQENP